MRVSIPLSKDEYDAAKRNLPRCLASLDCAADEAYGKILAAYFPNDQQQLYQAVGTAHGLTPKAAQYDVRYQEYLEELLRTRIYAAVPRISVMYDGALGPKLAWIEVLLYLRGHLPWMDFEVVCLGKNH